MSVAKYIRPVTSPVLLHAIYHQPKGPVGGVEIFIYESSDSSPGVHITVSLMPRERHDLPGSDQKLADAIRKLGDASYLVSGAGSFIGASGNKEAMQFLKDNHIIDPDATVSPAIAHTTLNLSELKRGKLLDPEVADEIIRDVNGVSKKVFRPEQIKTMPIAEKMAANRN